jgi:GNAT superfamily N-acetyltransferase
MEERCAARVATRCGEHSLHWTLDLGISLGFGIWTLGFYNISMSPRSITVDQRILAIRLANTDELIDLRHRVLRAGLPREEAVFPGDDLPSSRHFGAFDGVAAVCCATFHRSEYEGEIAWRLRGMATDEGFRSRGVGREVLKFSEDVLMAEDAIRLLWCNARIAAVKFYQSQGWGIVSELFDIPTAGLHHRMVKRL